MGWNKPVGRLLVANLLTSVAAKHVKIPTDIGLSDQAEMIKAQMGQGCVRSDIYQLHFYDSLLFVLLMPVKGVLCRYNVTFAPSCLKSIVLSYSKWTLTC